VAYADHADHNGKNIYPAVGTVAKKTGLDERTIQRLTNDLEQIGLLVEDGVGPRGTNRWCLPYSEGGDKLSPRQIATGDKSEQSLGDIPSGDIPSGDKLTPEVNKPEPKTLNISDDASRLFEDLKTFLKPDLSRGNGFTFLSSAQPVSLEDGVLTLAVLDESTRDWLDNRLTSTINRMLPGFLPNQSAEVQFVVMERAQ
jgi:hypothetical protein